MLKCFALSYCHPDKLLKGSLHVFSLLQPGHCSAADQRAQGEMYPTSADAASLTQSKGDIDCSIHKIENLKTDDKFTITCTWF